MSQNNKLKESDYEELIKFKDKEDFMFIFYCIVELESKLRAFNNGRLGHFDGAFSKGILAGYNGKKREDCPYKYTDNEYYGGYTWSDEWAYHWQKGRTVGIKIKENKLTWQSSD